jgi:glucosyl-3-phosphoglycerate synthase
LIRRFHHSDFDLGRLLEHKREPITVVLPAREVADTIGQVVERLRSLDPLIDQILVVDADSRDGTAEVAARAGAEVRSEARLVPEFGQVLGKGDAMWRAIAAVRGEVVVYLDSDTRDFSPHFALGMLGPLLVEPELQFVKAFFRRPHLSADGTALPLDGGRVTELTARPLLSAFFPDLAGFVQPLAGEVAMRRRLLERIPFATGYAVETAMLLHARDELGGIDRMAQVDLDERLNRHQALPDLAPMAYAVLRVVLERLRAEGRLHDDHVPPLQTADGGLVQVELAERPPYATLRRAAA